ncbi:MAG: hypothetical protein ACYCYP_01640 [Leptospirales bacterium]
MSSGIPPVDSGAGGRFPDLSETLWSALERLFPSSPGVLTLFPRTNPETGLQSYWSPDLARILSSPPVHPSLPPSRPVRAEVFREGEVWTVRIPLSEKPVSHEGWLEWEIRPPTPDAVRSARPDPLFSQNHDMMSAGVFRSGSETVPESEFFYGPFPSDPTIAMKPEASLLEIRWPAPVPIDMQDDRFNDPSGEERKDGEASGIPFRLEVRFPGGETAVIGGVYDSARRTLSVSARLSSSTLAGFWNRSVPEMTRDLSEVFRIRMEGRLSNQGGSP